MRIELHRLPTTKVSTHVPVRQVYQYVNNSSRMVEYMEFFRALSSRLKLDIVLLLRGKAMNVSEIAEQLGEERSTVSHALRPLHSCGFLTVQEQGRQRIYTTNTDTIVPLLELINHHMNTYCERCKGDIPMIDTTKTIAQIVAQDYRTAPTFKKFGLDFCCGGNVSLKQACEKKEIDEQEILKELSMATQNKPRTHEYQTWSTEFLIDYIINTHHGYIRTAVPQLSPFLQKVVRVHGKAHPELIEIQDIFEKLSQDLLAHIQEEEEQVFPALRRNEINDSLLEALEADHEQAGAHLRKIRELTNDYTPPQGACNTYRVVFSLLLELEEDMHLHVHLENNILFEKARAQM